MPSRKGATVAAVGAGLVLLGLAGAVALGRGADPSGLNLELLIGVGAVVLLAGPLAWLIARFLVRRGGRNRSGD